MIPILNNGSPHNRAVLEDLLYILQDQGFDINTAYDADIDVDSTVMDIEALFEQPRGRTLPWWNRFRYVGTRGGPAQ